MAQSLEQSTRSTDMDTSYQELSPKSATGRSSPTSRRRRKVAQLKRIPLWYFLHELLQMDTTCQLVEWTDRERFEFTIKNPAEVAYLWGNLKDKSNMTYPKLARGIRYYYGKRVIEKVPNSRFCYQFIYSEKTRPIFKGKGIPTEHTPDATLNSPSVAPEVELVERNLLLDQPVDLERDRSNSGSSNSTGSPASSHSDDIEDHSFFNLQLQNRDPSYYHRILEGLCSTLDSVSCEMQDCSFSPQSSDGMM